MFVLGLGLVLVSILGVVAVLALVLVLVLVLSVLVPLLRLRLGLGLVVLGDRRRKDTTTTTTTTTTVTATAIATVATTTIMATTTTITTATRITSPAPDTTATCPPVATNLRPETNIQTSCCVRCGKLRSGFTTSDATNSIHLLRLQRRVTIENEGWMELLQCRLISRSLLKTNEKLDGSSGVTSVVLNTSYYKFVVVGWVPVADIALYALQLQRAALASTLRREVLRVSGTGVVCFGGRPNAQVVVVLCRAISDRTQYCTAVCECVCICVCVQEMYVYVCGSHECEQKLWACHGLVLRFRHVLSAS